MLSQLMNGVAVRKRVIEIPHSKLNQAIGEVLVSEGYLSAVRVFKEAGLPFKQIACEPQYDAERTPRLHAIRRMSKTGKRMYRAKDKLPHVYNGLGICIVSTSRGVMTAKNARKLDLGGEVLCTVW